MVNACYASPYRACSPHDYACSGGIGVQIPQTTYIATLYIEGPRTPNYSYLFVETMTGNIIAEVLLNGVTYSKVLNDSGSMTGTLMIDQNLSARGIDPYDLTTPDRRSIYVMRDGVPMWGGILWTRKYDSTTQSVALGAGDWWSYFDHRKVLPFLYDVILNPAYIAYQTVSFAATDQNTIARALISGAQTQHGGNIGIVLDTTLSSINRDRTYNGFDLVDVGGALRQLANVLNGPDMMFDTRMDSSGNIQRVFLTGSPMLGQSGSPHVWEYGGNIQSYIWPSDGPRMATKTFAVGNGIGQGMPISVSHDATRYALGWPLLESETSYGTVTDPVDLQSHADSDLIVSRAPVVLPTLTVRGDVAPVLGAYNPGDDARIIIQDQFLVSGIDVSMRIVRMDVSPSENAGEKVVLTMAPFIDEVSY